MEITRLFDEKKRNFKSKSTDGDHSKRLGESSLRDSIANATNSDVFTESLKSEDCVAILYSFMKKLEEEMKKVLQIYEKTNNIQIKRESQLNSLSVAMGFTINKFEE